jgi:lycopene cyclase domain-containing protein
VNLTYLAVVLFVLVPVFILCGRASRKLSRSSILFLTGAVLVLTLVFDNLLVGLKIVDYDPAKISGLRVPLAPIEDFGYVAVAVILLPVLWQYFGKRQGSDD